MVEILEKEREISGIVWMKFKQFCMTHDPKDKNFISDLYEIGNKLEDEYRGTPFHWLEVNLFSGFCLGLLDSMGEQNGH